MEGRGSTTAGIAQMVSQQIGSTIVDKTGLTGNYDYSLSFMPPDGGGP